MDSRFLCKNSSWLWIMVFLIFFSNCQWIKPADPNFRTRPLKEEKFSGFIARDFFQIIVKVDTSAKPIPIREIRQDCKRRSVAVRNRKTIPMLLKETKSAENDRLRGINRILESYPLSGSAGDTAGTGYDPSGSSSPIATPLTPLSKTPHPTRNKANKNKSIIPSQEKDKEEETQSLVAELDTHGDLLFEKEMSYLQGEFAWFLDSYQLYKEDYSNPKECVFIYRIAKKGLYDRLEKTKVSIRWEDYE